MDKGNAGHVTYEGDELLKDDLLMYIPQYPHATTLDVRKGNGPVDMSQKVDVILADTPKDLKRLHGLLNTNGTLHFTYSGSTREIRAFLKSAGFTKEPELYFVYPGFNIPRFIIPENDTLALRFSILAIAVGASWRGTVLRLVLAVPLFLYVARLFFRNHAVYIKK